VGRIALHVEWYRCNCLEKLFSGYLRFVARMLAYLSYVDW